MRAAVLAGGLGTRLRPYTAILPKALIPVGDRPILELIFGWLAANGVSSVDVCLGHLGELIQTYFAQVRGIPAGLDVRWRWEPEPEGTAGALRSIEDLDESLLVINGDVLTDLDAASMLAFHHRQRAGLSIAVTEARVHTDLGVVELQEEDLISGYVEKPVITYSASMGVYIYEPRVISALPRGRLEFPDLVRQLIAQGERVAAFRSSASWQHIGTLEQHERAIRQRGEGKVS